MRRFADRGRRAWYGCTRYPACVVRRAELPNGAVDLSDDSEIQAARSRAHLALDALWQNLGSAWRDKARRWVAQRMGLEDIGIGTLSVDDCRRVIDICKAARPDDVMRAYSQRAERMRGDDEGTARLRRYMAR